MCKLHPIRKKKRYCSLYHIYQDRADKRDSGKLWSIGHMGTSEFTVSLVCLKSQGLPICILVSCSWPCNGDSSVSNVAILHKRIDLVLPPLQIPVHGDSSVSLKWNHEVMRALTLSPNNTWSLEYHQNLPIGASLLQCSHLYDLLQIKRT